MSVFRRLFGRRQRAAQAAEPTGDPARIAEVEAVLGELRHLFLADGGDMRVAAVDDDGWVSIRTVGACSGCGVRSLTLQSAIAPRLRERCPWFRGVRTSGE